MDDERISFSEWLHQDVHNCTPRKHLEEILHKIKHLFIVYFLTASGRNFA